MDENQLILVIRPLSPLVLEGGLCVVTLVLGAFAVMPLRCTQATSHLCALERAAEARRERTEFKGLVKTGEISLADALADDRAKRIRVHEFLMCIPGIGKAKADDIMRKLGIAENRRVQGLGSRQREGIVELVAKLK